MPKGVKFSAPNSSKALPSKTSQDERKLRKQLEKEHGYGYTEPLLLTLLGITLFWNIEKQVKDHEERKNKKEKEETQNQQQEKEERRRHSRRGERRSRRRSNSPPDYHYDYHSSGSEEESRDQRIEGRRGRGRTASRDTGDGRSYSRDVRSRPRWYDDRYDDRHVDRYDDRNRARSVERRSRRDTL